MAKDLLAPQQARSRESMNKLLKAAAEVLGQHGVDGATIPRIAQHAGLTPGAVYRRFPDKDALLETAILGIFDRQEKRLRVALTPDMARQIPLAVFADQLISSMLFSYRASAALLRAVRQFVQSRADTPFYRKVVKLEMRSFRYLVDLLLVHRKEMQHRDPEKAVSCAIIMLTSTLVELLLVDHNMKNWRLVIPHDDQFLKRELLRSFLNYLGVEAKPGRLSHS